MMYIKFKLIKSENVLRQTFMHYQIWKSLIRSHICNNLGTYGFTSLSWVMIKKFFSKKMCHDFEREVL